MKPLTSTAQAVITEIKPSAFCWRPYWSSRFESLWSLLRKFAHLNATTHREIRRLFGRDNLPQSSDYWKWCLRSDLRHFGALDASKLAIIFGSSYEDLSGATVVRYVPEHEAATLTCEFLRFCPTCIYQGFHSPLHQLLFLTKCPAHGDKLEIRCTDCSMPNIPYKLPSITGKDLLKCRHMLYGLNEHLTYSNAEDLRKEAAEREKGLLSDANWLMKRVALNRIEEPVEQWLPSGAWLPRGAGRRYLSRYIRRLPAYWADVFKGDSFEGSFNISKTTGMHIQIRFPEYPPKNQTGNGHRPKASFTVNAAETWDLELYRIYKAIRRHLVRNHLLCHRRCIVKVGRNFRFTGLSYAFKECSCPAANALLLWRMFYEGAHAPPTLFKPRFIYRTDPPPRIYWDRPSIDIPDRILRRIFTIECVGIFHECLLLAEAFYRSNTISFDVDYVRGRRKPHWLIEGNGSAGVTLHWWASRSLSSSSFFSHNSSYHKSCDITLVW